MQPVLYLPTIFQCSVEEKTVWNNYFIAGMTTIAKENCVHSLKKYLAQCRYYDSIKIALIRVRIDGQTLSLEQGGSREFSFYDPPPPPLQANLFFPYFFI